MRRTLALILAATVVSSPLSASAETKEEKRTNPLVWVGFGTAGLGLLVGSLFGADSIHATNTAKTHCVDNRCGPKAFEFMDQANTSAWVSNVAFGVAVVGLGVGVYGLLAPPPAKEPSKQSDKPEHKPDYHPAPPGISLNVQVGPGAISLRGEF